MEVVRAERRHLSAHQTVLTRVIAGADLLPMAFGMISDSEETLCSLLAEHIALLSRQLAYVGGRVEMAVPPALAGGRHLQGLRRALPRAAQAS